MERNIFQVSNDGYEKSDIQEWLTRNNIPFTKGMLKPEHVYLCKLSKPQPRFVVHEMLKEHGHTALRLPPYHADLNPVELIWANSKVLFNIVTLIHAHYVNTPRQ